MKKNRKKASLRTNTDDPEFLRFAKRVTAGIDDSGLMLGIYDERGKGTVQWYAFALQIGRCLMDGKPLLLIVPTGSEIPDKLRAAATVVEYYTLGDLTSCELATKRALAVAGLPVHH
jgi:hypothetical protein